MDEHQHHEQLIQSLSSEYKDILTNSEQGVYIYLDDMHKICNKKFAEMLDYSTQQDWAKIDKPFTDTFVADESQELLVSSFMDAMEKNVSSTNEIVWRKKDGSTLNSTVILTPISFNGHLFALHFVTAI